MCSLKRLQLEIVIVKHGIKIEDSSLIKQALRRILFHLREEIEKNHRGNETIGSDRGIV